MSQEEKEKIGYNFFTNENKQSSGGQQSFQNFPPNQQYPPQGYQQMNSSQYGQFQGNQQTNQSQMFEQSQGNVGFGNQSIQPPFVQPPNTQVNHQPKTVDFSNQNNVNNQLNQGFPPPYNGGHQTNQNTQPPVFHNNVSQVKPPQKKEVPVLNISPPTQLKYEVDESIEKKIDSIENLEEKLVSNYGFGEKTEGVPYTEGLTPVSSHTDENFEQFEEQSYKEMAEQNKPIITPPMQNIPPVQQVQPPLHQKRPQVVQQPNVYGQPPLVQQGIQAPQFGNQIQQNNQNSQQHQFGNVQGNNQNSGFVPQQPQFGNVQSVNNQNSGFVPQQPQFGNVQGNFNQNSGFGPKVGQQGPQFGQKKNEDVGGTEVNTSQPSSLPRPNVYKFNEAIKQPDTSPLFYRITRGQKVNMSRAQSDSEFIRTTIQCAPNTPSLLKKFGLPFGITLHPFANKKVPVVSLGFTEVIRCYSCRSYINPFVTFMDRGYKWKCNLCKTINDVPKCYMSKLDDNGCRVDLKRRKELRYGSIEYVAPRRYNTRLTYQPTCFVFLIDVSYHAVVSGSVKIICDSILKSLDYLPSGNRSKIAIITYDRTIHFYDFNPKSKEPKMMVVGEINESLLPLPKHLLVSLSDCRDLVEKVLKLIPTKLFPKNNVTENALFSTLNSARRLITRTGGKIFCFLSSLPTIGRTPLKNRDKPSSYNTQEEIELIKPVDTSFKEIALELCKDVISVDLFCVGSTFMDIATLNCLTKYTSGNLNHYPNFNMNNHGSKLRNDIIDSIEGIAGYDGVMRVRVSQGLKVKNFYGNFFIKGHDLLSLPFLDSRKGFGIELEHDSNFISTQNCSIQSAVLYTTPEGERRIRVHNLTIPITSSLADLYKNADVYSSIDLLGKKLVDDIPRFGIAAQRKTLLDLVVQCLRTYRQDVRNSSLQHYNQLILADNVRLLPLYSLGLLKHPSLIEGYNYPNIDYRSFGINEIISSPTIKIGLMLHPEFYNVNKCFLKDENDLKLCPLSRSFVKTNEVYIMNDSKMIYILIGEVINQNNPGLFKELLDLQNLFNLKRKLEEEEEEEVVEKSGEEGEGEVEEKKSEFDGSDIAKKVYKIVKLQREKYGYISVLVITQKSKEISVFIKNLIEDQGYDSPYRNSYDRHIVNLHQRVVKTY